MNNAFYHLSETLLDTITEDFNDIFKNINGNPSVLIPSAGDGVIADHLKQKAKTSYRKAEIDCIEEDPCLAKALETKDIFMVRLDWSTTDANGIDTELYEDYGEAYDRYKEIILCLSYKNAGRARQSYRRRKTSQRRMVLQTSRMARHPFRKMLLERY